MLCSVGTANSMPALTRESTRSSCDTGVSNDGRACTCRSHATMFGVSSTRRSESSTLFFLPLWMSMVSASTLYSRPFVASTR